MKNIIIVNFFFLFFLSSYLHAETISTATTQTSSKTITEDLTITSTGSINCIETAESGWANCIKIQDNSTPLTITNRGSLYTTSNDNDKDTIIRARDSEESDLTIKNYGTMESIGNSTLYLTNLSDGDGDGIVRRAGLAHIISGAAAGELSPPRSSGRLEAGRLQRGPR